MERALATDEAPRLIVNSALVGTSQAKLAAVGTHYTLVQMINRRRRGSVDPNLIIELVLNIDETLMFTETGDCFYQFGPSYMRNQVCHNGIVLFYSNILKY